MRRKLIVFLLIAAMITSSGMINANAAGSQPAGNQTASSVQARISVPEPDVFSVDFQDGTATDKSEMQFGTGKKIGNPTISESEELHKNIAHFDGKSSAYQYSFQKAYSKVTNTVTMETMVKFNEVPATGEHDFFSNQQSGGLGLGISGGKLTFFAYVDGSYRQPVATVTPGVWYHIVGVVDGAKVLLYVNGQLMAEVDAPEAGIDWTSSSNAKNMMLGADSSASGSAEYFANVDMSFARMYSQALSADQIKQLHTDAFKGATIKQPEPQNISLDLVGSDAVAAGGEWNLNVQARNDKAGSITKIEYDLEYDPKYITYEDSQHVMSGVTVTDDKQGKLHIVSKAALSTADFNNFGSTRLVKLDLRTKDAPANTKTTIKTANFKAYDAYNQPVTIENPPAAEKTLTLEKNDLDLNGDGVVGAGDVALAKSTDQKEAIAASASIYPYKHAIILTMDGGGQVWNPDEIYYDDKINDGKLPKKYKVGDSNNPEAVKQIIANRADKDAYAMDLINNQFATSYTAHSVEPSISAQNYTSMLHGLPWGNLPKAYQTDNSLSAQYCWADFGKETAAYPSIIKAVSKEFPARKNAGFTEWDNIVNGIIEPDAQLIGKQPASWQSFYDVANYIKSDDFNDTAIVYMQSDQMDGVGHSSGWYNTNYWQHLYERQSGGQTVETYNAFYKAVMDALKESGHDDDTLIITNADHGGSDLNHGSTDPSNMDIFIGIGGETVNSGARLEGGTNADVGPIALSALRVDKADSMTGGVFDQNTFLSQDELSKKNRNIEKVTMVRDGNQAQLQLSNPKAQTRVVDAVIDLKGATVSSIDANGGEVLRQETTADGKLKLTISYDRQPDTLATITFKDQKDTEASLDEVMLGTKDGDEVYPDTANTKGDIEDTSNPTPPSPSKPDHDSTPEQPSEQPSVQSVVTLQDGSEVTPNSDDLIEIPQSSTFVVTMTSDKPLDSFNLTTGNGKAIATGTIKAWDPATKTGTYTLYGLGAPDGPDNTAGVYVNGQKLFAMKTVRRPLVSDTTVSFSMKEGKEYVFWVKPDDPNASFTFNTANGSMLQTSIVKGAYPDKEGRYYCRIKVTKAGGDVGVYCRLNNNTYKLFSVKCEK